MIRSSIIRHVPNFLSALRLLAAPLAAGLILLRHDTAALVVFTLAALSDAADGAIARRWGFISRFGEWLDPAADKLLMLFCFLALAVAGATPFWLAWLVVGRDAVIAFAWLVTRGASFLVQDTPLPIGRISTLVQLLYILGSLVLLALDVQQPRLSEAAAALCGLSTLLSGGAYGVRFLRNCLGHPA